MARKSQRKNYVVRVYPTTQNYGIPRRDSPSEQRDSCEEIAKQIKRHCDDIGYVVVASEPDDVCSHCGVEWTEASNSYNGGCCDKDEAAEESRLGAIAAVSPPPAAEARK